MSLMKQLTDGAAHRLSPKAKSKRDVLLDAMREFRNAKSDEEALEAMQGFIELIDIQKDVDSDSSIKD